MNDIILGIDASTNGSGGVQRHLIEILRNFNPNKHKFSKIVVWGSNAFLNKIPNNNFVTKISHPLLNKSIFHRFLWQYTFRLNSFREEKISILFNPFGTYIGKYKPYVTMSQNMLVFDKKEQKHFGLSLLRLKFILLYLIQKVSFSNANGIIFISNYAKKYIENYVNYTRLKTITIYNGVSDEFKKKPATQYSINHYNLDKPFKILYVSPVFKYKHHLEVIEALFKLRSKGYPILLQLVGGVGQKKIANQLKVKIDKLNHENKYIFWETDIDLKGVVDFYHNCDAFIFASSCENMPNILIEALASSLPIACSSRNPMPEFLGSLGYYFNPESVYDIEIKIENMLKDSNLRTELALNAQNLANQYTWETCSDKTYDFLYSFKST